MCEVVVDAQRRAVLENHARRAFHLDCEQVQWILEPADFKLLAIECAGLYGAAVVARLHQLDAIFAIFGAFDRDKRLILKSRG